MQKIHYVNKPSQLYVVRVDVKSASPFSASIHQVLKSYRVADTDSKARAVLEWLKSEENYQRARALFFQRKTNIDLLDIPARTGTKKHYEACALILTLANTYQDLCLRRFAPGVFPELVNNF